MTARSERGAVLLEAMVALAILGIAAGGAAWTATELTRSVERAHAREREVRRASRLLAAVSLWPREDLDRHLGLSQQGEWDLLIDRPTQVLYLVVLRDRASGSALLRTARFLPPTEP